MSKCRDSALILRSVRSTRLEGWRQWSLWPSFKARPAAAPQDEVRRLWRRLIFSAFVFAALVTAAPAADRKLGIGQAATTSEIAGWDIDVRADGRGLPAGKGSVKDGEEIYMGKCAACHGEFGESAGRWPMVAGGQGTLKSDDPVKTVGSYFAYLSTVIDYVRRAMPFGDAQSLTNDELYAVVAYMLYLNDIVDEKFVLSKETFAGVKMPNATGFHDDDRETAEKSFWNPKPCMADCKPEAKVTGRARVIDVTPDDKSARKSVD